MFVTGLHRSGTTILSFILGAHSECIAIGEVSNVISANTDRAWVESHYDRCTCGTCEFWPQVMSEIDKLGSDDYAQRYLVFRQVFEEFFPDKIPVDSSKHIHACKSVRSVTSCKIVKITRDFRGWSFSTDGRISFRKAVAWYRRNRNIDRSLDVDVSVSYECLVFEPENEIRNLCDSIGLDFEEPMLNPGDGESHVLSGNRMRLSGDRNIKYDKRWMHDSSILASLCLPAIVYNRKEVHRC